MFSDLWMYQNRGLKKTYKMVYLDQYGRTRENTFILDIGCDAACQVNVQVDTPAWDDLQSLSIANVDEIVSIDGPIYWQDTDMILTDAYTLTFYETADQQEPVTTIVF